MRLSFVFLTLLQLFLLQPLFPQSGSLAMEKDTLSSEVKKAPVEHLDWQDSAKLERILQNMEQHGQSLDEFLAERKEQERKENRRKWIRIGAGAVFLFAFFYSLGRRFSKKNRTP